MKLPKDLKGISRGLDGILDRLDKLENTVKDGFKKIENEFNKSIKYLDDISREVRDKISEYKPIIVGSAIAASPLYTKAPILAGLQIMNLYKDTKGKLLGYGLIIGGITAAGLGIMFGLNAIHSLPSNNEHLQYLGSPNGYIAFEPNGHTINYDGHTDPTGTLILPNGKTIDDVIWNGQYSNTIIQNHDQMVQLNNQFVGQTDPVNNQPYVNLQDFYVIKGQVPIMNTTIDGQTYTVIDANNINPADIAGFYTYQGWVNNFEAAMNTPGTYAAGLPGNSPVFQWTNTTGTVAEQTMVYQHYIPAFDGGYVLVVPNKTIISYGAGIPSGSAIPFDFPQQGYNPSS
jgi:hypothetical protein